MAEWSHEPSDSDLTSLVDQKNSDWMIKQLLLNWVCHKVSWFASHRSVICLSLPHWQIIIEWLTADKSRYFAQPHAMSVNYVN